MVRIHTEQWPTSEPSRTTPGLLLEIVRLFAIAAVKRQQDLTLERRAIYHNIKTIKTPFESTRAQGPKEQKTLLQNKRAG